LGFLSKLHPPRTTVILPFFFFACREDDLEIWWQKASVALYGVLAMWCGGRDRQEMSSVQCAELTTWAAQFESGKISRKEWQLICRIIFRHFLMRIFSGFEEFNGRVFGFQGIE